MAEFSYVKVIWELFDDSMTPIINCILREDLKPDVILLSDAVLYSYKLAAHKLVLIAGCGFFRGVFHRQSEIKGNEESEDKAIEITVPNIAITELYCMIQVLYAGEYLIEASRLAAFFQASEYLGVTGLVMCIDEDCRGVQVVSPADTTNAVENESEIEGNDEVVGIDSGDKMEVVEEENTAEMGKVVAESTAVVEIQAADSTEKMEMDDSDEIEVIYDEGDDIEVIYDRGQVEKVDKS